MEDGYLFNDYIENICFVSHVVDAVVSKIVLNEIMVYINCGKALWKSTTNPRFALGGDGVREAHPK